MNSHSPAPVAVDSPTAALAAWASGLRYEDIPADVVARVQITLLDTLGVAIAALEAPDAAPLVETALEFAGEGPCLVPGAGRTAAPAPAALVWGTLTDIFELQDGWRFGGIHASLVFGAALPLAQALGKSGRDLITAVVAGYEAAHRVAWSVHPEHMGRGHMPNGTAGTVGAAAAAAHLLGLDAQTFAGALGTAGFLLPYATAETLWAGHSAKPLHTGWAAKTGIEAALMARKGFWGCPLEGTPGTGRGFLQLAADTAMPERLTEGLGTLYTLRDTYFKFYPICRQAQSAAEAAITLARAEAIAPDQIAGVTVSTWDLSAKMLTRYIGVESGRIAAQFSLPYIIAASLTDREMGVAQLSPERLADPALHGLAAKVVVVADPEKTAAYPDHTLAEVTVTLTDRSTRTHTVDAPRGDPRVPVTDAMLIEKFFVLAQGPMDSAGAQALVAAVQELREAPSLDALMAPVAALHVK
ncbi:MmgE/PrpD family protein [Xanthobacter dioxanivorans]|uniref:MmgE/PrpD family protein n=1 Tax=Xanthobacter dioxanivorans TaxID=2528964 RepID=A0A974PJE6_9HYPH|nr:MmgE/PrpD family protein [Xanthobacter dioxanivorans]QRG04663.1 MmgE/PrpD family protein [Xanthobacter dioxanivorans]